MKVRETYYDKCFWKFSVCYCVAQPSDSPCKFMTVHEPPQGEGATLILCCLGGEHWFLKFLPFQADESTVPIDLDLSGRLARDFPRRRATPPRANATHGRSAGLRRETSESSLVSVCPTT